MSKLSEIFIDISDMEKMAGRSSLVHRLDPRCKLLVTLLFTITVVSFNRYDLMALIPCFTYPLFLLIAAEIPFTYLMKKLVLASIFALMLGIVNPFFDRETMLYLGSVPISGGWVSFISIMLRFALTASAALLLLTTTGMYNISRGLEKLGVPQVFVMQLFFLSRYLFLLTDEASRLVRARAARSFGQRGLGLNSLSHLLSTLFMRYLIVQKISILPCAVVGSTAGCDP